MFIGLLCNDRAYIYIYISSYDFAILTLTVFTTLHNSIREKNYKIHSVETVSEVSQKARVKIVTYVNQKVGNG